MHSKFYLDILEEGTTLKVQAQTLQQYQDTLKEEEVRA